MLKSLVSLFLIFSFSAFSQSTDEKEIRKVLTDQTLAWNHGDLDAFMQTYWKNDSLMFIGKSGVTHGWQQTLDNYKNGYPDTAAMGKLSFEIIQVKKLSPE